MGKVLQTPLNTSDIKSRAYICRMSCNEMTLTHVILNRGKCEGSEESQEISVCNRDKIFVKENNSVCVEGERIDILEMLVEFITMVKVLGVILSQ